MRGAQTMTEEKREWILSHNDRLIRAAQQSLQNLSSVSESTGGEFLRGQKAYWKNVVSALKWSSQVAIDTKLTE